MQLTIKGLRIRGIFAWYDLWVGVFVDTDKKRVYIFPVPTLEIVIEQVQRDAHA